MKKMELQYAKRWSELDWDSLVRYHSIPAGEPQGTVAEGEVGELMVKMQEFEVVSGMNVVGFGCNGIAADGTVEEKMAWLEKELGEMGSCVWMKSRNDIATKEDVYVMEKDEFVRVVREVTAWMDKKEGLLKLPEKWVEIEGEVFALPSLIGDGDNVVRYGQYGDMQMYMLGLMKLISKGEPSSAELEQLRMYRNGFLSTLMLPTVVEAREDGTEKRRVVRYDKSEREFVAEKMDKSPVWLFSMLWHLVQSCLAYYHGRFPDLVSGGKTSSRGKNTDMYVAKLGTDNAVMKYAGYPSVEAVNNEPVGVILERLDAMAKESKEWEKARRRK